MVKVPSTSEKTKSSESVLTANNKEEYTCTYCIGVPGMDCLLYFYLQTGAHTRHGDSELVKAKLPRAEWEA